MNISRLQFADSFPVLLLVWILALLCSINVAIADNGVDIDRSAIEETIRKALPNTEIDSVQLSVVPGLVEIVAGGNLFYFDPTGRYLVVGSIYDMRTATDLTAQRKREVVQTPKIKRGSGRQHNLGVSLAKIIPTVPTSVRQCSRARFCV